MFPIFINDGSQKLPDDDIFYVICKEGVYLKKKMGVMESMAPVKNISILESIEATARMHIISIPGPLFAKVMSFFKAIYQEHRSEAIVLIFYDEKNHRYKIFPPYQKVNFGTVDYNKGILLEGWQMIGTIHSHASMSAFHSGTDDSDEASFDGLHITIGDNDDDEVSISASIVANATRFIIDPLEYIDDLAITVDVDKTEDVPYRKFYKWENGKMVKAKTSTVRTYRKMDKRYVSTVSASQQRFNKKWMKTVEYITPTYHYGQYGIYSGMGVGGWGGAYDPNAWQNWRRNKPGQPAKPLIPPKGVRVHPQNVGPHKVAGVKFPPHEDEDMNPCEDCVFKNHKIDWVMQQLLEEVDEKETKAFPEGMEAYECTKCQSEMVIPETQDAVCPICKTDIYLDDVTPVDDNDLEVTYECLRCLKEFSTDEDSITCPTCKKNDRLILLQDADYTVDEEEEDIPYECSSCGKKFFLVTQEKCPHCDANILETEAEEQVLSDMASTEDSDAKVECLNCKITLLVKDLTMGKECPFCRTILNPDQVSDFLDPTQEIIQTAIEADNQVERLPIPDQGVIPINKPKKKEGAFSFMKRLARKKARGN
jgi:DNA-directed RNA polymerase subunit RPC12/RpoP